MHKIQGKKKQMNGLNAWQELKHSILVGFWELFWKIRPSVFDPKDPLTSCKNLEKSCKPFLRTTDSWHTDVLTY